METIDHNLFQRREEFGNVMKSDNDNRSYKILILKNRMKVLLISDPTTDKAAAALDVNIGYLSEPNNLPRFSHLLQHVLYLLEMENSPQQKFKEFVSQNNGEIAIETTEDHSSYFFDIAITKFKDALTSFAQLFINPVDFTEVMIKSELQNVNTCNCANTEKDNWEVIQLFKSTIDCSYQIFQTMLNEKTTGFLTNSNMPNIPTPIMDNIVKYMQKFYDCHYSSHIMTLCILSNESLEQLKVWVENLFSQIKLHRVFAKKDMRITRFFPKCHFAYKIYGFQTCSHCKKYDFHTDCKKCDFHTDYKKLYIIICSEHLLTHQQSVPFLTYLFEYGGKGSLMSVLKAKDWGNSIKAGSLCSAREFTFFNVAINLTDKGLEHIDDIVTLFFQYVKLLKKSNGNEYRRIYNEYKEIGELKFRFKQKETPLEYVKVISRLLQHTGNEDMIHILRLFYGPVEYERFFFEKILNDFLYQRMRICIIAEKFKTSTNEFEHKIGTFRYRKEKVSVQECAKWLKNASAELNLPVCNEFLPATVYVNSLRNLEPFPKILWDTGLFRIWYKRENELEVPKTTMIFHFITPLLHGNSVNLNIALLFREILNNSLREHLYPASLVNFQWHICITGYGILLKINGFDEKLLVLFKKIMDQMMNFKLNPEDFENVKQKHKQLCKMYLEELETYQLTFKHLYQLKNYLLPINKIVDANESNITFEKAQQFISNLFNSVYVEFLIHGNMSMSDALTIAFLLNDDTLQHVDPLPLISLEMYYDIDNGCKFANEFQLLYEKDSCIGYMFYPDKNNKNKENKEFQQSDVLLDLVQQIARKHLDILKSKEELGCLSACTDIYRTNKIQGLRILVEGLKSQTAQDIKCQIEIIMRSVMNYIVNMSEESFQENKALLITSYCNKKPKTLNDLSNVYWDEIFSQQYNFNRINLNIDHANKITKDNLSTFCEELYNNSLSANIG